MGWSVLPFLVVGFLASSVKTEKCGTRWHEPNDKCLPGETGYYTCNWMNEYEWKTVNCEKGALCRCTPGYWLGMDDWYKKTCKCAVVSKPSFPQTGVIRWNGTLTLDPGPYWSQEGRKRNVEPIHGMMYMDDAGYFLMKKDYLDQYYENDLRRQKVVKIMVPKKNGKFTKITRWNQGVCHENEVAENKESLNALWDFAAKIYIYPDPDHWHLLESTAAGVQKWGGSANIHEDAGDIRWTLTVEKSKEDDNVAIPKHLLLTIYESGYDYIYRTDVTYSYESVSDTLKEKLKDSTERSSEAFFQLLINKYCPKQK